MKSIGDGGFLWFVGIVEDVANDEHLLGRCRIRAFNHHDNVEVKDLPWASVMLPTTTPSFQGSSDTPSLAVGTIAIGFFADGEAKQMPIVMGALPIFTNKDENKHSLSFLARGKQILKKILLGPEPESPYAAQYPFNRVISSRSGHIVEVDDSPGAERLHVYHKSGSYVEIHPDGTTVIKSVKDSYNITGGTNKTFAEQSMEFETPTFNINGSANVTENLTCETAASGTFTAQSGQTVTVVKGIVTKIT